MFNWQLFIYIAGYVIGLGAVTVIDSLGFVSRKNKKLTQVTIYAHHVTKPLIWIGTILLIFAWIFISDGILFFGTNLYRTILYIVMILNGCFLSFYVSPRLDKLIGKKVLIPVGLQKYISFSFVVSIICWWGSLFLFVLSF